MASMMAGFALAGTHMAHFLEVTQGCSNVIKCLLLLMGLRLNLLPVFICTTSRRISKLLHKMLPTSECTQLLSSAFKGGQLPLVDRKE